MVKIPSRFRPQISLGRNPIPIYDPMSFCEDLSLANPANILPIFIHLLVLMSSISPVNFDVKFRSLTLTTIAQPPNSMQDPAYDIAAPYIFIYLATLIPKNPTPSLSRFLRNREIGLRRALGRIGLLPPIGNYVISNAALTELQDTMNANPRLLGFVFETVLGYCNADEDTPLLSYANELVGQLRYANMSSIELIEEYLIGPRHPCLQDRAIGGDMRAYTRFKGEMKTRWGNDDWVYSALLDKMVWLEFSRTHCHERLRIIAGMFASDQHFTYDNLQVSGNTIAYYKGVAFYNKIYNAYGAGAQGRHATSNQFGNDAEAQDIEKRAVAWAESLNLNPGVN